MKFLLVDDSSTMRRIIKNTLTQLNHTDITEAVDGQDALAKFQAGDFEFILSDWNMPNMNGLEFLQKVREVNKTIPFVMVTTEADKSAVLEAVKAGVTNYVTKPFQPEDLETKINQSLAKSQS